MEKKLDMKKIIGTDIFFYIAMLLITFETFPFDRYGLGSRKALSIFPMILYVLFKFLETFENKKKIKINKYDTALLFSTSVVLIMSLYYGCFVYHSLSNFRKTISMFATCFFTLLGLKFFTYKISRQKLKKMFLMIYRSFSISLVFGFFEFVYFYIWHNKKIENFITFFVRDSGYLQARRIQFNFAEAGNTSYMIAILLFLTIDILRDCGYRFTVWDKTKNVLLVVLSFLSASVTYILILGIYVIIAIQSSNGKKKTKNIFSVVVIFVMAVIVFFSLNIFNVHLFASNSKMSRVFELLFHPSNYSNDVSSSTRLLYIIVSLYAFTSKPITGYGWGYFEYALRENFNKINIHLNMYEFSRYLDYEGIQSQSIYTIMLSEGGIVGIAWGITFFGRLKNTIKKYKKYAILIMVILVQNYFYHNMRLLIPFYIITSIDVAKSLSRTISKK